MNNVVRSVSVYMRVAVFSAGRKELGAAGADTAWLRTRGSSYAPLPSLSSSSSSDGAVGSCFKGSALGFSESLNIDSAFIVPGTVFTVVK